MKRTLHRLSALAVTRAKVKGMLADGGGLYLQVNGKDSKSWIFRYKRGGKERQMGLGSAAVVTLADVREAAESCRRQLRIGIDPLGSRDAVRAEASAEAAKSITFADCTAKYIAAHEPSWRNRKHGTQWTNSLKAYAEPVLGNLAVTAIDTGLVLQVLEPIWTGKPETARRVRGRIEAILDWATARSYRKGENPARWRGHLDKLLPLPSKVRRIRHYPALPYDDLPGFMSDLRALEGTAARALEFTILTLARTGEAIGAEWSEIDVKGKVWSVPGERIKSSRPHRVPLSDAALEVVEAMKGKDELFLFPGSKPKCPVNDQAMLMVLERMKRADITVHGFRSTFRDWAAERTNYSREVAEMALAHAVGDKVEAAYRRGDLFEKRRRLMGEWAKFCRTVGGEPRDKVAPF